MNRKIILAAAVAALISSPAAADYYIKDGNGVLQQIRSGTVAGKILPYMAPVDTAGAAFGTVSNPFAFQFGTGVALPSFATPQHFICDAGCSGGGGGGGAVFGPTAVGSPAANPPVLIGGTIDGTATGAMSAWKVLSGVGFINCANCSGSGISVAYGGAIGGVGTPGGFKDGSGNFQPFLGDVTNGQWVNIKASVAIPVTGTFFQATQPISAASLPLPTGAATQTTLASILTALGSPFQAGASIGNTAFGISGTLPAFAATPTFNLGTLNGAATAANQAAVTGPVAAGTAATNSRLVGGVFNSSPITVANTQQAALQIDANGFLKVNVAAGGASGGTSSTFGATFPGTGTAAGMSQGGNMVALTGTSGNLNVQCANCSGSGASAVDEATITFGTSVFAPMGGAYQTTATSNPLVSGQQGMAQLTINRALHTNLRSSVGVELGVAAAPLQVSLANTAANGTALLVTGSGGTFPVTGTVTANAGTNLNTSLLAIESGGNLASIVTQLGAVTASPTANTISDRLKVINTTLGTPFQAGGSIGNTAFGISGTLPAFAAIPTFKIDQTTPGTTNLVSIGTNGTVNPQTAANWGIGTSTQNSASVANGHLMLGQFNTTPTTITTGNMSPLQMDSAGNMLVNIKAGTVAFSNSTIAVTNAGTFAVQLSGSTNNINNISGTISLPTGAATAALQPTNAAQGSTTSGQTGPLMQAAVLTAAPTYTTAQTSPLSMDTAGNLRVSQITGFGTAANQATIITALNTLNTTAGNPLATQLTTVSIGGVGLFSGGTIMSATNGLYTNLLQGNAVIASGNPLFAQLTAGSAIVGNFRIDQTTPGTTNGVQDAATSATASAVPSKASYGGVIDEVGGNLAGLTGDPCQTGTKTTVPITLATAAVKVIATGVSAKKIYVCQLNLNNNAADSVALFEATTGTTCATSPVAVVGAGTSVATADTGYNFGATSGISLGTGSNKVLQTTVNNNDLCVAQSAATQLSGSITFATR